MSKSKTSQNKPPILTQEEINNLLTAVELDMGTEDVTSQKPDPMKFYEKAEHYALLSVLEVHPKHKGKFEDECLINFECYLRLKREEREKILKGL